jgi:protein phosphatase
MKITIHKPAAINEIGKRRNNEDSVYPKIDDSSADDRLFIVCDGVGGASRGEVASAVACDAIRTYFKSFLDTTCEFAPSFIEKAVRYTEIRFDEYIKENPSAKGMATTLSLLYISSNGIFIAHAGDSRIYQFRNGRIIYRTEDHSYINSLVRDGQIKAEEARNHPRKNVIYKAIQGTSNPVAVETRHLTDILPGDQFLLCTDGVTEGLTDAELTNILDLNIPATEKLEAVKTCCSLQARDNFSAYLIPISTVDNMGLFKSVMASFLYAFM